MFWNDLYGCNALFVAISSTTRNTGNIGNRIETARLGPTSHVEQTENKTGNIETHHPINIENKIEPPADLKPRC
jgi:hypothetical protein